MSNTPSINYTPIMFWFLQTKLRFTAGFSKYMTKDLLCLLTKLLNTITDGLLRYCNTKTSSNGINNKWILKNSTSLLSSLDQLDVPAATFVNTFYFSMLHTSVPYNLLKSRVSNLVHNAFKKKKGERKICRYQSYKIERVFHS